MNLYIILISIFLFTLSIPPMGINSIAWIALVPFYAMLFTDKQKLKYGFLFGSIFGGVIYGPLLLIYGESLGLKFGIYISAIILNGMLFILHSASILIIQRRLKGILLRTILISLVWISLEFITNKLFYGFTIYLGLSQYRNYLLIPAARYVGIYGISFLIIVVNQLIANIYLTIKDNKLKFYLGKIRSVDKALIIIVIFIVVISFGIYKSNNQNYDRVEGKGEIKISLIQGNISTTEYDLAKNDISIVREKVFKKYLELSQQSVDQYGPRLIVWPETAVQRWLLRLPEYRDKLYEFAIDNDVYLLIGSPDLTEDGKEYNSAFVISPQGRVTGRYDKNKLVPFLEDVFTPGEEMDVMEIDGLKVGVQICFESLFPNLSNELARKGANSIFIISNNGMFGLTTIPYFTSAFSIFRAVENNIYVIQVMNTGITKVIDPQGRVVKTTKLYEEEIINYSLPILESEATFYSRYGERLYQILFGGVILLLIFLFLKKGMYR